MRRFLRENWDIIDGLMFGSLIALGVALLADLILH